MKDWSEDPGFAPARWVSSGFSSLGNPLETIRSSGGLLRIPYFYVASIVGEPMLRSYLARNVTRGVLSRIYFMDIASCCIFDPMVFPCIT
jgi:hypothetical protein